MIFLRALRRRGGFFFAFLLAVRVVHAHDPFASTARALVGPDGVEVELTLNGSMGRQLLDGRTGLPPAISDENFARFAEPLRAEGKGLFTLTAGKNILAASDVDVARTDEGDVQFSLHFPRPAASPLRFHADYLTRMSGGHVGTLYVEDLNGKDLGWAYLDTLSPNLDIPLPAALLASADAPASIAPSVSEKTPAPPAPSFGALLRLGVKHILTGYDHLLFLAGLLVACRRFATMAGIITCFTLAHSITLALAAFDVVSLPSRVVEPLIAASIVFVGIENLLRRGEEPRGRWLLTFGFGLVHGFGFASVLKGLGLGAGGAALAMPLFSFNLGVEIGQLAVAVVLLPLLFLLRRRPNFVRYGLPAISSAVALLGAYWLLQRTVLS